MDFHGITMVGKFIIQKVETLPTFTEDDTGRIVYNEDDSNLYYGDETQWTEVGSGGGGGPGPVGPITDSFRMYISGPNSVTITLDQKAPYDYTIDELTAIVSTGSLNLTVQINGVPVTGINNVAINTIESTNAASSGNDVLEGDTITLIISNVSMASNLALNLDYTRDL